MRSVRSAKSALLVMVLVGGSAALAESKIYLAEYKFNDPKLYRMDLDGGNVEELSIIPTADWLTVGLQVDQVNSKIYWTHGSFNNGRIRRANLDGTSIETIVSGLTNPRGLALDVDGEKVYWSDTQDDKMYRANLDGSGMEAIVDIAHQLGNPTLDLVNSKLYFGKFDSAGGGDIRRTDLDGSNSEVLFAGLYTPIAVALDLGAQKIYWADSNTSFVSNHIARANFDGTELEILYEGQPTSSGFTGIALDLSAGKLYWSDEITDVERGVWWANLDGSDAERIYASPTGWKRRGAHFDARRITRDTDGFRMGLDRDGDAVADSRDGYFLAAAGGGDLILDAGGGELLAKNGAGHGGNRKSSSHRERLKLKDFGIGYNDSSRWQAIPHYKRDATPGEDPAEHHKEPRVPQAPNRHLDDKTPPTPCAEQQRACTRNLMLVATIAQKLPRAIDWQICPTASKHLPFRASMPARVSRRLGLLGIGF